MAPTSLLRRLYARATLFSGWAWVAAASLIGFEMFDIVFGAFILAPELLPVVVIGLAVTWVLRERVGRVRRRVRVWRRVGRMRRG